MATPENVIFNWTINNFLTYPTKDNFQNVVFSIIWTLEGTYTNPDNNETLTAKTNGKCQIDTNNITDFIPYENITLEMAVQWIESVTNVQNLKQYICDSINYPVVTLPPPF
jgi:hypothetical protein